jgi:hypothetical protein
MIATDPRAVTPRLALARRLDERRFRLWAAAAFVLVAGYLVFARTFAYLGVPGTPLFVGEALLGTFLLLQPSVSVGRIGDGILEHTALSGIAWPIAASLAYGVILAVRGSLAGYPRVLILQEFVFDVYPVYLLLGIWLGERDPRLLGRWMRALAWINGIYGLLYIAVLSRLSLVLPGTSILLFQHPLAQAIVLIGLLAFPGDVRGFRRWLPFVLNVVVLLALQSRASWVGFMIALPIWALSAKQFGRMLGVVAAVAALLAFAWVADLKIPGGRGLEAYSARNIVGAAIAPFDEEAAAGLTDDAKNFAGTTEWRTTWWTGIWDSAVHDAEAMVVGHGYGFELTSVATLRSSDPGLRTPHNWFFFALGYGGAIGVILFLWLLVALARLLSAAQRRSGVAFGLPVLFLALGTATFAPYFETPFAAIPTYILLGMAAAPALARSAASDAPSATDTPTSPTRRPVPAPG